jgi:hypothetical protein
MHQDSLFRQYLQWYHGATQTKLWQRWTDADYAEGASSNDEETVYDTRTHASSHVKIPQCLIVRLVYFVSQPRVLM